MQYGKHLKTQMSTKPAKKDYAPWREKTVLQCALSAPLLALSGIGSLWEIFHGRSGSAKPINPPAVASLSLRLPPNAIADPVSRAEEAACVLVWK